LAKSPFLQLFLTGEGGSATRFNISSLIFDAAMLCVVLRHSYLYDPKT